MVLSRGNCRSCARSKGGGADVTDTEDFTSFDGYQCLYGTIRFVSSVSRSVRVGIEAFAADDVLRDRGDAALLRKRHGA